MMSSSCYHLGDKTKNRQSDEYTVTNIDAANKRGNKNLFKTALEKLNKKYKKHKKINDNLYEVIVIYKDKDEAGGGDDRIENINGVMSEPLKRKVNYEAPKPPPRTRSRSHSRHSMRSYDTLPPTPAPTPPPRSRRNSRCSPSRSRRNSSCSKVVFSQDTIPPTPPPRSRPQSRSSCRGPRNDHSANDKRKPPLAPPRSPFVKDRKIRKKIRDDDIKGILESVIAIVSETDLTKVLDETEEELNEDELNIKVDLNKNIPNFEPPAPEEALYAKINHDKNKIKEDVIENTFDTNTSTEDNIKNVEFSNAAEKEEDTTLLTNNNNVIIDPSKVSKHEVMQANNERMNTLWDNVKHASNLSLNKVHSNNNDSDIKETYIGCLTPEGSNPGYYRSQSVTQLSHQPHQDHQENSEGGLSQLTPQDRVKRSLERLDVPDWYKETKSKDSRTLPGGGGWRKGSVSEVDSSRSRHRDRSLPPPSPVPGSNRHRPPAPHHPRPVSPPSPSTNPVKPYLGWRSQEKLPTFLDTEKPSRIGDKWKEAKTETCTNI